MNFIASFFVIYLTVGILVAITALISIYWAEKNVNTDSEAKNLVESVDKVRTKTSQPYITIAAASILFWPVIISKIK